MQFRPNPTPEPIDVTVIPSPHSFHKLIALADVTVMTGPFGKIFQQVETGMQYQLTKHCFQLTNSHTWHVSATEPMLVLSYTLEGSLTMQHSLLGPLEHHVNSSYLYYLPTGNHTIDVPAGVCTTLKLHINFDLLKMACHGQADMNDLLNRVRDKCPQGWVMPLVKTKKGSSLLLTQITACLKTGGDRKLAMDRCIVDLLQIYVKADKKQQKKGRRFKVRQKHVDTLRHAEQKFGNEMLIQLNLKTAAQKMGMTALELTSACKIVANKKWTGYQKMLKIKEACRLLLTTDKTAAEICYEVYYQDPPNFGRAFKEEIGCTPEEYRRLKKADQP